MRDKNDQLSRNVLKIALPLALQSMGITVVRLRQDQIAEPARLRNTADYIGELMGKTIAKHTQRQHKKLACLQADVLSDWWRIGT